MILKSQCSLQQAKKKNSSLQLLQKKHLKKLNLRTWAKKQNSLSRLVTEMNPLKK